MLRSIGNGLHGTLEAVRRALEPVTRLGLGSPLDDAQAVAAGLAPFEREADALISRQRTHRAQAIVRAAVLVLIVLLAWAALAQVDEVTRGDARVIPSRQLQVVQSLDGGVVQPGKDLVEIVPLDDSLVLEARVAPKDIAFIVPGQAASVKFSAYDFSIYGGLDANVENISPDTVVDERGNAFYLVRVRTKQAGFNDKLPIIPGMTAEVDVLTGKKSVLSYLLKPVLKVRAYALSER